MAIRLKTIIYSISILLPAIIIIGCTGSYNDDPRSFKQDVTKTDANGKIERIKNASRFDELFTELDEIRIDTDTFIISNITAIATAGYNGDVIIADSRSRKILVVQDDGILRKIIGGDGSGPGEFRSVQTIYTDTEGNLYVLDGNINRITIFDTDYNVVAVKTIPAGTDKIIPDVKGNYYIYYVANWRPGQEVIGYIDGKTGNELEQFGDPSEAYRITRMPMYGGGGMVLDDNENLYVIHPLEYRIFVYNNFRLESIISHDPSHFHAPEPPAPTKRIDLNSFTPIIGPLFHYSDMLIFQMQIPKTESSPDHTLEFITSRGEFVNGGIVIPDRHFLLWIDRMGKFYFKYQPLPDSEGFLDNQMIRVYSLHR